MNYIRHLNAFFSFIRSDNRLTSSHVSLYMALFQYWNFNRFQNPFPVYRENMMQLSKIGSKNTYHKCIKQLHQAQYILYHPPTSKFQLVKISMIRLDTKQEASNYKQLDLFSPNIETDSVSNLTAKSTDFDTGTVPKMGQYIKQTYKQERETPTHQIFKRNKKIQKSINDFAASDHFPSPSGATEQSEGWDLRSGRRRRTDEADMAGVPKSLPMGKNIPSREGFGVGLPSLNEVEEFFKQKNYPATETKKFYNHYKAIGWKIQGKTPIEDWKALIEKWMENAKKWNDTTKASLPLKGGDLEGGRDIQYLYERFLESKKIFKYILPEHFDQLKLELNEETFQQARRERIEQLTGTNQNSIIQLWQAYLKDNPTHELVLKDQPNLIALAKRMAVIKHFNNLKNQSS